MLSFVENGCCLKNHYPEKTAKANKHKVRIADISSASREQAQGVSEISTTIANLDEMTQRGAAQSERSAASARELAVQADALRELVAFFRMKEDGVSASRRALRTV